MIIHDYKEYRDGNGNECDTKKEVMDTLYPPKHDKLVWKESNFYQYRPYKCFLAKNLRGYYTVKQTGNSTFANYQYMKPCLATISFQLDSNNKHHSFYDYPSVENLITLCEKYEESNGSFDYIKFLEGCVKNAKRKRDKLAEEKKTFDNYDRIQNSVIGGKGESGEYNNLEKYKRIKRANRANTKKSLNVSYKTEPADEAKKNPKKEKSKYTWVARLYFKLFNIDYKDTK